MSVLIQKACVKLHVIDDCFDKVENILSNKNCSSRQVSEFVKSVFQQNIKDPGFFPSFYSVIRSVSA